MDKIFLSKDSIIVTEDGVEKLSSIQHLRQRFPARNTAIDLPNHTISFTRKKDCRHIFLETPLQKHTTQVKLRNNGLSIERRSLWWPPSLWSVIIKPDGSVIANMAFMDKPFRESNEEDSLYVSPYGNQYKHGEICWGNATIPTIYSLQDVERIPYMFFDSIFNGDLLPKLNSQEDNGRYDFDGSKRRFDSGERESFLPNLLHHEGVDGINNYFVEDSDRSTIKDFIQKEKRLFLNYVD